MENKGKTQVHFVVENLRKIMNDNNMSGSQFADRINMPEAKLNKILNGRQNLKIDEISEIARKLQMREIDLYTYPEKYYPINKDDSITKALLTIELRDDLKEQILNLVFKNSNIELLNS